MTLSLLTPETLMIVLLLSVRIGAIVLSLPLLDSRNIPAQLKVLFILMLGVALYPLVQTQQVVIPQRLGHLGLVVVSEMLIGLTIGFVAQVLFAGIQLGGEIISQQKDGSELRLTAGMSYLVGDDSDAHRSYSPRGAKLFIVD